MILTVLSTFDDTAGILNMLMINIDKHFSRPSRRKRQSSKKLTQIINLVYVEQTKFVAVKLKILALNIRSSYH